MITVEEIRRRLGAEPEEFLVKKLRQASRTVRYIDISPERLLPIPKRKRLARIQGIAERKSI